MLNASKSLSPRWMLAYPSYFDPDVPRSCSTEAPPWPRLRTKEARAAAKRAEPRLAKEPRRDPDMSLFMEERRLPLSLGAWGSPVELDLSAEDMIGDIERI